MRKMNYCNGSKKEKQINERLQARQVLHYTLEKSTPYFLAIQGKGQCLYQQKIKCFKTFNFMLKHISTQHLHNTIY